MNWIGLDYGKRFIGVAVGNEITLQAEAIGSVSAYRGVPDWNAIDDLIVDWHPAGFILGYPLNMDGSQQNISRLTTLFRKNLIDRYNKPCYLVDERLTSHQAKQQLSRNSNKSQLNATAAQIILQHWFDEAMPTDSV